MAQERNVRQRLLRDPNEPPPGWIDCPPMGDVVGGFMVPIKTPLSGKFRTGPEHWAPHDVIEQFTARGLSLCLVLDLNNSNRYYSPNDFHQSQVDYVKVACKGRGESPDPAAVNAAVYHLTLFQMSIDLNAPPPKPVVAIHCTHGFNRTGYIMVCAMARLMAKQGMTALRGLRAFAAARPPGIYKHDYITDLFTYHHEQDRRKDWPTPPLPEWKGDDAEDDEPEAPKQPSSPPAPEKPPAHDDVLGEAIPAAEEDTLRQMLYHSLGLMETSRDDEWQRRFPGSQPVSLERRNMFLLTQRRYYATWKADGTRYMLLINHMGTYLINRNWSFRRVQMRFPTRLQHKDKRRPPPYPVGEPHILTLLDGEMVVDHIKAPDGTETWGRRFLAYDLLICSARNAILDPFKARYEAIETEVVAPRVLERRLIQENRADPRRHPTILRYRYEAELFSVRRKEFWPLYRARKLIQEFIPTLSHEADGLIFQGYEEPYVVGTCHELLKYKFPHLNSVDFQLRMRGGRPQLLLMDRRGGPKSSLPPLRELPDAKVRFPEGVSAEEYDNRIVECTWDFDTHEWLFLRERTDKGTPNAWRVYQSVWQSIQDNITDQDLLEYLDRCVHMPHYATDLHKALHDKRPLPPRPDDVPPYPGHPDYTGPPEGAYPYPGQVPPGPPGPPGHYPPHDPYTRHPDGSYPPPQYPPGPPPPHHHHPPYPLPPHHGHPSDGHAYPPHNGHPSNHDHTHPHNPPTASSRDPTAAGMGGGRTPSVFKHRRTQPAVFRPYAPDSPPYNPEGPFPYLPPAPEADSPPPPSPPGPHPDAGEPAAGGQEAPGPPGSGGLLSVPLVALEGLDDAHNPKYADDDDADT